MLRHLTTFGWRLRLRVPHDKADKCTSTPTLVPVTLPLTGLLLPSDGFWCGPCMGSAAVVELVISLRYLLSVCWVVDERHHSVPRLGRADALGRARNRPGRRTNPIAVADDSGSDDDDNIEQILANRRRRNNCQRPEAVFSAPEPEAKDGEALDPVAVNYSEENK